MEIRGSVSQLTGRRKSCINWVKLSLPLDLTGPFLPQILSVTGFVDSDRGDLKLMVYLAGAKYMGYLCHSNTVLICRE